MNEIDPQRLQAWKELLVGTLHTDVELSDGRPIVVDRQYADQRTISTQNFRLLAQAVFPDTTWRKPGRAQTERNGDFVEQLQKAPTEPTMYHFSYPGLPEDMQSTYLMILPEGVELKQRQTAEEVQNSVRQRLHDLGLTDAHITAVVGATGPALAVEAVLITAALRRQLRSRARVLSVLRRALEETVMRRKLHLLSSSLATPSADGIASIDKLLRGAIIFVETGWSVE